ncbi:family 10 glycosylhydrolase [Haladaptatus sp. R4]|uniref:family 10 glycosylhydrolase n=1 Tax=Haladaptatus sp. R4 TaxID=1679489 RepID=UPI0009EF540A|nr:family 10 glycosylhydrolase [Haladaptatus sp. R4]
MSGGNTDEPWWNTQLLRAVTLYPWATMRPDAELKRLANNGVNTVFVVTKESDGRVFYDSDVAPNEVPGRDLLGELTDAAAVHDINIVPTIFVLCDKYLLEQYPETVQIAKEGTEIRYPNVSAEHMHWACPSHDVVSEHLHAITREIAEYDVDGIQFTHFEFQPIVNGESSYLSCYCDNCREQYELGDVPDRSTEWIDRRCKQTASLLRKLSDPFRDRSDFLVNIELEAFSDLETAIDDSRRILGVDQRDVARYADMLTPRTAHIDLDMHPVWIREVVRSFREETNCPITPSIRTGRGERPFNRLEEDELVSAIQLALHGGAHGVSLFSDGANIGRLTADQWDTATEMFDELDYFDREYGPASRR